MNFKELIENDDVLSQYDFETVYSILMRLLIMRFMKMVQFLVAIREFCLECLFHKRKGIAKS